LAGADESLDWLAPLAASRTLPAATAFVFDRHDLS